jgi:hypothetical protein
VQLTHEISGVGGLQDCFLPTTQIVCVWDDEDQSRKKNRFTPACMVRPSFRVFVRSSLSVLFANLLDRIRTTQLLINTLGRHCVVGSMCVPLSSGGGGRAVKMCVYRQHVCTSDVCFILAKKRYTHTPCSFGLSATSQQ